jgi:hypothetical protein
MDPADRQIDLIDFLNTNEEGLKEFFKFEFMKGLVKGTGSNTKVRVEYPGDSSSKFIALYGFDEFFETLPSDLVSFSFINKNKQPLDINLPDTIGRFKSLGTLNLTGCVSAVNPAVCGLDKLKFLSLVDNKNLQALPECIANMENLLVLNLRGSRTEGVIPPALEQRIQNDEEFNYFGND